MKEFQEAHYLVFTSVDPASAPLRSSMLSSRANAAGVKSTLAGVQGISVMMKALSPTSWAFISESWAWGMRPGKLPFGSAYARIHDIDPVFLSSNLSLWSVEVYRFVASLQGFQEIAEEFFFPGV